MSKDTRFSKAHDQLLGVVHRKPEDYEPFGAVDREKDGWHGDCSSGCVYYLPIEGMLGMDWGVCANPASHRVGLLTFEHQGCRKFTTKMKRGKP